MSASFFSSRCHMVNPHSGCLQFPQIPLSWILVLIFDLRAQMPGGNIMEAIMLEAGYMDCLRYTGLERKFNLPNGLQIRVVMQLPSLSG
jgi:hypothetical protein